MLSGTEVDLSPVQGRASEASDPPDGRRAAGIAHARELVAFADAVMAGDADALADARDALARVLGPSGVVDAAAVIAMFNVVDRVADAIGIPLDEGPTRALREAVGKEVGLEAFHPDLRAAR